MPGGVVEGGREGGRESERESARVTEGEREIEIAHTWLATR